MLRDDVLPLNEIDSLSKEIECIMCLNTPYDSRMCIHCSAIICVKCIEDWISKRKSCPKCSHSVQSTDFIKCRLVNKLIDFIEISKLNNCSNHPKETPRVYCSTCEKYVCSDCISLNNEHLNHNYKYIDEDYKQILTLNHKLIDFIRKRCKRNQDKLHTIELAIQMLFSDHSENIQQRNRDQQTADLLIKETESSFDNYQQKKQVCNDAIQTDELLIIDIERRLNESKSLSEQEEILQILQKNITSRFELKEDDV